MRLRTVTWASDVALILEAAKALDIDVKTWTAQHIANPIGMQECIRGLEDADIILMHPTMDTAFEKIFDQFKGRILIISYGLDQALWGFSNVDQKTVATVNAYAQFGGLENIKNMLACIGSTILGVDMPYSSPKQTLWHGLYHPDAPTAFESVDDYLRWYRTIRPDPKRMIGILFFRTYWANGDLQIVNDLVRRVEERFDVISAFCLSMGDKDLCAWSSGETIKRFFGGRVELIINLQSLFHSGSVEASTSALKEMNVPAIHPLMTFHRSKEDWLKDEIGLGSSEVGWSVAMPEFEGLIEPIIIGAASSCEIGDASFEVHSPITERIERLNRRICRWMDLRSKPAEQRKVAFILHNNPCASAEASVGAAAHLDSLESLARILQRMKASGYVVDPPSNGAALSSMIMKKKAIHEFRWTTVQDIVSSGGALALVDLQSYARWFDKLPADAKESICSSWGMPPGEEKDGVPPAMLYDGKLVVSGIELGNAVVCVQPKRGCAGSRCDGKACRILHDPLTPPPHQYLATYSYLDNVFGADVIVHVGTHGNIEFLPGKPVAQSGSCMPDIAIGDMPHLYIYNSDNPPEGTIAKRRTYAVLVDHMQTALTSSGLYGELKDLEEMIAEYNRTRSSELGRAHSLEHMIRDQLIKSCIADEIGLDSMIKENMPFSSIIQKAHSKISEMYTTWIPNGMHIFGNPPKGERKAEMIASIMRFDGELERIVEGIIKGTVKGDGSKVPSEAPKDAAMSSRYEEIGLQLIEAMLSEKKETAAQVLHDKLHVEISDGGAELIMRMRSVVEDLSNRIDSSDEMGSLLRGIDGGFIEPGPSGLITRGKPDVLPTGRNFYSLDPGTIPTKAAWMVGRRLAGALLDKYVSEEGSLPENVGMYWMANDIMWADGEQLAQMLYLIGVEPVWNASKVTGFHVIPLQELGRPRIDVTVRVSGISRDCFFNCIEFLDRAIKAVHELDEPEEENMIRKHAHQSRNKGDPRRIFASKPGTYGNGVNLAVYASAWKEESDLTDIFVQWNSFAYGAGVFGVQAEDELADQLRSVDLTFNKTVTDEYDLLGCCCYFGTHGGLTNAAAELSGHEVASYYGDTRNRERIEVRTLADEVRRVVRTRLLNPKWIEGMKRHGYKGAGDISSRIGRIYGWEATTSSVDDRIFDDIAKTFILNEENRKFFQENNPWAMEEISRRLLEASSRDLWKADEDVLSQLKETYLEIEGWMEEGMGDSSGSFQGGSIDVIPIKEARNWRKKDV